MQELGFGLTVAKVRHVAYELATRVGHQDLFSGENASASKWWWANFKGWINSELFLEWFTFFTSAIPPARPVILIMDSHASHINPTVISLAKENSIFLFTFSARTKHLLQPLDVGIYKPLKSHWAQSMNSYMTENSTEKPNRTHFHTLLNPHSFSVSVRRKSSMPLRKLDFVHLKESAIPREALRSSQLTNWPLNE
ncbi:hypothetical protein PR048_029410 [Dryococelus australis]|uniref:DDE-1 domain-containing protein n=1 Tax=Dryococelus australis TaxID=614101 RepID=A0ABQ9GG49_9NEOP|nr:hypothetical protein PR048_029410 [Dryococelus australis]